MNQGNKKRHMWWAYPAYRVIAQDVSQMEKQSQGSKNVVGMAPLSYKRQSRHLAAVNRL